MNNNSENVSLVDRMKAQQVIYNIMMNKINAITTTCSNVAIPMEEDVYEYEREQGIQAL